MRRRAALGLSLLAACAHAQHSASGTSAGTAGAAGPTPSLTNVTSAAPLTPQDIDFYAGIMRAAADRLDHLTPDEQRVLAEAHGAGSSNAAADPTRAAAMAGDMMRAVELETREDDAIVRAQHVDTARYNRIRDRIEAVVPAMAGGADGDGAVPAPVTPTEAAQRHRAEIQFTVDSTALAPRWAELQRLIWTVRMSKLAGGGQ
jgi:hypothetical protein